MRHSTDRILTTHAGSLPRPPDLKDMVNARSAGQPVDDQALTRRVRDAVREVVRKQLETGIDVVNDGELSKTNFTNYARERIGGYEVREYAPGQEPTPHSICGRDLLEFREYFETRPGWVGVGPSRRQVICTGPLKYIGQQALQTDLANFKAALEGVQVADAFLPAVAPGTIEHWLRNEYYATDEEYLYAIADAMHEEYKAIADAGFILQIDAPDLPDAWQIYPDMTVPEYRKYAQVRVEALNHALRGISPEQVRLHVCWGSYHGPHKYDIPLREIVDLVLSVPAQAYSIEASNPRHEHEWRVWEDVKLPEGKILIPGVVSHCCDFVEHPELVAQRLVQFARLVGRENVIAGTDCGLGERVGHPSIVWAKFEALAEGARLASRELWS
ncbi:MAG TPA: cobalamin-independent methionine synthase II family protein [Chloroflexota bacterium]|nr:cobalamin-independent methionine synthase II family protein [Chloroflexota bacterium]